MKSALKFLMDVIHGARYNLIGFAFLMMYIFQHQVDWLIMSMSAYIFNEFDEVRRKISDLEDLIRR